MTFFMHRLTKFNLPLLFINLCLEKKEKFLCGRIGKKKYLVNLAKFKLLVIKTLQKLYFWTPLYLHKELSYLSVIVQNKITVEVNNALCKIYGTYVFSQY